MSLPLTLPPVASLKTTANTDGANTITTMLRISSPESTETWAPVRNSTPKGSRTGVSTASTNTATSPSVRSPPQIAIHANPALAVGTRNSRTMPAAMSGLPANPSRATAHATTGITT